MVSIEDLDIEDVLEGLPIDEKLRASQIMYIHGEDGYTPIKGKDYFDGNDGKDGKDGKDGYTPIKGIDYDDGQDYVLTEDDIKEIASKIEVPIVEKEIETVIIEKPIITNEIKEVAMYELAEDIVKKINSLELEDEYKIDASHIKNLPVFTGGGKRYALNGVPTGGTTGQVLKKKSNSDYDLEWGTGGGGSGIVESIVAGTNITVDSTDPANPIVNLDADIAINSVHFDSTPTSITPVAGDVIYNTDEDTLDVVTNNNTYQLGQEISLLYKNQTGSTIGDATPVTSDGSVGASGRIKIKPAIADGSQDGHFFLGLTTQSITDGSDGKATYFGKVRNIDTTGTPYGETWADGDNLWVSPTTAGYITNVQPTSPNQLIYIGNVINAHATNGTILVKPVYTPTQTIPPLDDVLNAGNIATDKSMTFNINGVDTPVIFIGDGSGNNRFYMGIGPSGSGRILVYNELTESFIDAIDGYVDIGLVSGDKLRIQGGTATTSITAQGASTDVDIEITPKGTGALKTTNITLLADDPYDATSWDGNLGVPTKNAIRDKIESMGGGGVTITTIEKDLGDTPRTSGEFTITGLSGLTPDKQVVISQASGPYTGKGTLADEGGCDQLVCNGYVLNSTTLQVYWQSITYVRNNFKFNYFIQS